MRRPGVDMLAGITFHLYHPRHLPGGQNLQLHKSRLKDPGPVHASPGPHSGAAFAALTAQKVLDRAAAAVGTEGLPAAIGVMVVEEEVGCRCGVCREDQDAISADARFVAFQSEASNLVREDTNGHQDVFVANNPLHDRKK